MPYLACESSTRVMRIIFMGTPEFAVPSLRSLVANDFTPIAVVTGADKKRGRGRNVSETAVKKAALDLGISNILQPESVKSTEFAEAIEDLQPDLLVVVAFRILPARVFIAAKLGAFNLHGSVLPAYRGAAPIHHAVLNGDSETGVTTFFLKEKVDTGNVILTRSMPIGINDTTGDVHDRMMYLGAEAVLETVKQIADGTVTETPQDESLASPAPKVFRQHAQVYWREPANKVHNHIRGYSPVPGAWTLLDEDTLRLLRSELVDKDTSDVAPGTVISSSGELVIACEDGAVSVRELQLQGRKALPVETFLNGNPIEEGYKFVSAESAD